MRKKLIIKYNQEESISVSCNDFEVDHINSGFVLFHAIRKAFLDNQTDDKILFNKFIEVSLKEIIALPQNIVEDFNSTLFRYNNVNRKLVYQWDYVGSMLTSWTNCIEILDFNNQTQLVYSVCNYDYEIDGMGWDCANDFDNIISSNYLQLDAYLTENTEKICFNELTNSLVYDESGRAILLAETLNKINEMPKLIKHLKDAEEYIILDETDYQNAISNLYKILDI